MRLSKQLISFAAAENRRRVTFMWYVSVCVFSLRLNIVSQDELPAFILLNRQSNFTKNAA